MIKIPKKEFYFVRHGQTDYNASPLNLVIDHPSDLPINATGRLQAQSIEPIVAGLPVKTICCSPFLRAQQTKDLISPRLSVPMLDIEELGECMTSTWNKMYAREFQPHLGSEDPVISFMERVKRGLQRSLAEEGPVLIIAHGGVHLAICHLLDVSEYEWVIDNCSIGHFSLGANGLWKAKKII